MAPSDTGGGECELACGENGGLPDRDSEGEPAGEGERERCIVTSITAPPSASGVCRPLIDPSPMPLMRSKKPTPTRSVQL